MEEDFVFYWLFDWKLKKFILYQVKLKKVLVSYLSSQRNIINLISITSNWKKTLFFTDLLNGNSKISYFFESNRKKITCFLLNYSKKLLNLIFYQVKLEKELIFHWYFAGKLKIFILYWIKSIIKLFSYLFSQRKPIHLISIESNSVFKQNSLT